MAGDGHSAPCSTAVEVKTVLAGETKRIDDHEERLRKLERLALRLLAAAAAGGAAAGVVLELVRLALGKG